ncbi:hypothetical protein J3R30DRAFT_1478406 [Lentinula aciculospora]|uniref:C3H1-type domain-containing protein n=1 Tax=Lentinula aciculospora TaxID=153920 RepID=A0A9W9AMB5_9AGAR|nr:hypothetical protein J3R30DRAFT_1478406 [Lentinula aciculospora]
MSVTVDPYWRVKTKPCEFYRKGRCLFGEDRCNFLHVMNDWNPDESTFIESKPLQAAPVVKIFPNTPPSASLHSIQSPPRSPRTTNLLLALKGIIRDEEEQEEYIDDLSIEAVDDYDNDSPRTTKQTVQQIDTNVDGSNFCDPVSTLNDEAEHSPPSPTHSGLLSPVEFSDLQLRHFSYLHSNNHSRNPSLDPGFYDPIGTPHSQWVSPSPMVLSPPRSPALSSTFELLASPFGSPSTRLIANPGAGIMSPRLGVFGPRKKTNLWYPTWVSIPPPSIIRRRRTPRGIVDRNKLKKRRKLLRT